MKLYTEEQVLDAYNAGNMDGRLNNMDYSTIDGFKPIELPSDEEIEKALPDGFPHSDGYDAGKICGFEDGAKWMKEQILNQKK